MPEPQRLPLHRYDDPLARVWIACAERIGFRVHRTREAYASTDGRGGIFIAVDAMFDPDDCLAQMIFHELCHALVEGEAGETRVDWGLGHSPGADPWREHACLRLQAWLAYGAGLRDFFAPTTDFRVSFWNSLPADPFAAPAERGGRRERSCVAGRLAARRAAAPRWARPLEAALKASAAIAGATPRTETRSATEPDGLTGFDALPSLWTTVLDPPPTHPAGHAPIADYHPGRRCADCAWGYRGRNRLRCRHAPGTGLPDDAPACARFEPAEELDCHTCGACCREAYDSVEISPRDPVNLRHPELVENLGSHRKLRRDGGRCAALTGGGSALAAYACGIYPDRPRTCQEFARGGGHCLEARRRVGLSL